MQTYLDATDIPVRAETAELYLDLIKRCLAKTIYREPTLQRIEPRSRIKKAITRVLAARGVELAYVQPFDLAMRNAGFDWPPVAHTMIGMPRLDNIQFCTEDVIRKGVPGDFIETGVWRGGATILMRAVLKAHGDLGRRVWVADSFEGFPPSNAAQYPHDAVASTEVPQIMSARQKQVVSLQEVQTNFVSYGLLDEQVRFVKGWFSETLPPLPVERLAVARLDSGTYESTTCVLNNLYPKVSPGGYVIIDDYGAFASCRHAVDDYRAAHGIGDPIRPIDSAGVFWQKIA